MSKILFIITKGDNVGGAQIYVLDLAVKFKNAGYDVECIVGSKGFLSEKLKSHNVAVTHISELSNDLNLFTSIKSVIQIVKYLKRSKPGIVSLNSTKAGILGRLACYFTKTPTVLTVHGWSFTEGIQSFKKIFFQILESTLKKFCTAWIVVSKFDYDLGIKFNACEKKNTYLIHNGVDIQITNRTKVDSEDISIVVTARHDKQKDYLTIFTALQYISNVKVYLLGDGPLLDYNKMLAAKLNVLDKIIFVGFTSDVQMYLAKADIFLLITNWEGFPISILEAMNNRLPVIATNICGISEAVIDGVTGFLVKPKSADMLAYKINLLANDFDLRQKMGESGYSFLKNNFSSDVMFQKTKTVFNKYMKVGKV